MPDERHPGFSATFRDVILSLSILLASPCIGGLPGALVGDCNEDGRVAVNELVSCVNIALGLERLETCPGADPNEDGIVRVDELVEAVGDSLGNPTPTPTHTVTRTHSRTPSATTTPTPMPSPSATATTTRPPTTPPTQILSGTCRRPDTGGLVPCQAGTIVSAYRCENRATCTSSSSGRTLVGDDDVDSFGFFSMGVPRGNESALLVLETEVGATLFRSISFGGLGAFTRSLGNGRVARGPAITTTIDPISEASVRILDDTARPPDSSETDSGLPLFQVEELEPVIDRVMQANSDTDFSGESAAGAVEIARQTADTPEFQIDVIRQSLNTFIRTDRGCQETGQFPIYGNDEPIVVTYRVDDLFGGEPVPQAAARITFFFGITLLEEDVPTDDAMGGQLVIVGSFETDATLLLTADANGITVTTGCRIHFNGSSTFQTPTPTPSATPTGTGSAGPIAVTRCSDTLASPLPIPDADFDGVSNAFVVSDDVPIEDLDVEVAIEHMYVGDLVVTLTHEDTETRVVLVDRAGAQLCSGEDMSCTFDDEAARFAGLTCSAHVPALGGGLVPDGFLGDLLGESLSGTWRLTVADEAEEDVGSLVSWCLKANSAAPVVTSVTCNDDVECVVELGEPFAIDFSFLDRDANANGFRITARDSSGTFYEIDEGAIIPPSGGGTLTKSFDEGFSCDVAPCDTVEFFVVVTDEDGQESPFASILITSLGTRSRAESPAALR